jgi:hypothetical protein
MIDGRRVIAWTPYGRRRTYSILIKYLARDVARGLVDEVWAFMNTDPVGQEDDIAYAHELNEQHDWFKLKLRPEGINLGRLPKQRYTGLAYRYMIDPDAIYLRLDDDVLYLHDDAIENLVRARIEMPAPIAIFPVIINNAICSHFLQACGKVPLEWGHVTAYCMDPNGWASGPFAVKMHELLLSHVEAGTVEDLYLYQDYSLQPGTQFSVSCFASRGEDYAALPRPGVLVPDEEESWHTVHQPLATGRPNIQTGLLDRYRELADKVVA